MERNYIYLYLLFKEVKERLNELERNNADDKLLKIIYCEIDNLIKRNR